MYDTKLIEAIDRIISKTPEKLSKNAELIDVLIRCKAALTALQEMSAREYHNIAKRMLDTDMAAFKRWWDMMRWLDDDALAFAQNWAQKHPDETTNN